ncbi:MAG TPA: hypothetical protein VG253_19480 [Streptosporangiaceae bacterium]|nr:hypothetical protein [Streptosporangiaceae bacterium]
MRGNRSAVLDALGDINATMEVDGYRLEIDQATAERLIVEVTALDGACEECLAPAEVIKMIISGTLDGAYTPQEIEVALPASATH